MKNLDLNINFLWITIIALFIGGNAIAQKNYTFYALENTAQSHYFNPAFKPSAKVSVSIPGLSMHSFGASNSGFNLSNLFNERPQDDSLQIDPQKALSKMKDKNFLTFESYNEIFAFGIKVNKNYFSFGITNRLNASFIYTKDLFTIAIEGNGKSLLGERASFDGTGINLNSYVEYALGFNREINDKLDVGVRMKILSGIANVNTRKSEFGIHTNKTTFDLTFDGSAIINTSGIKPFYDTLATDDYMPSDNAYNFKNFGLAFDLGASYKLTEKIKVSASLLDLGFITWKTENATFEIDEINYRFEGVYLNQFLTDSTEAVFQQLQDTLKDVFSQEESSENYRTGLATRFYLGGTYELTEKFKVGATLYNEIIKSNYRVAAIVSGTIQLKNWLSATINYSQYARSFGSIGAGVSLRGGPIQFFVASDNILGFIAPQNSKNVHLSFGLNLLFGKPDKPINKKRYG
ncbi:hypothetical protein ERX46_09020 [Brumimicrobium glaciale]|uniref:DUF5723 domain-containing protein n=1 Tax=Brumimicrobium glaciale TaxID=200475 RepID=A0A4Q4KM79_9FLAO|nr:DUF5723 family protein [Brumimicrobium glaciale]RYM34090.1 hypothetical protein ERX46_09020 [Brumimicrobium glaciale]